MNQKLEELLRRCTVKITVPINAGWGTGFFVAPELILTCAHILKGLSIRTKVRVRWQQQENFAEAKVVRLEPNLDLALLQFIQPSNTKLPCVYLDEVVQSGDDLYFFGYPDQDFPNGCPVTGSCEGFTGDIPPLIKFKLGQVRPGMSGSALLNQHTGKVCGMLKFTRDRSFDLGGGAIPTSIILEQFPELIELQQLFHQNDHRWSQQMEGAILTNPKNLTSTRTTLLFSAYDAATWVGRGSIITTLTQKLQNGCRILSLTGITGIGKTALAERLVVEANENGSPFHRLNFDDRGQGRDFLSGALTLLTRLGAVVTAEDQKAPQNALKHILKILRDNQFLVQIDSLEVLLQGNEQTGWYTFIDSLWIDFFQQLLAAEICHSQILITTQAIPDELEEIGARYPRYWYHQRLGGLLELEQLQLFEKNGLNPNCTETETLKQIGQLYQGHPLVLQVIAKDILDKPFNGNAKLYWQHHQPEFDEIKNSKEKRSSSRALQLRVKQRVEQSLKRLPVDAYQILCSSSVYRHSVPEDFWLAMLEQLPEQERWTALELLKSSNLVEEELRRDGILLLRQHNLVRSSVYRLIKTDEVAWRRAERIAAQMWLNQYVPEPDATILEKMRSYLEAFHHYCEVEDWKQAKTILVDQELGTKLRMWGYIREILLLYERILGKIDASVDMVCEKIIGNAYWYLSDYPQAIEHCHKSVVIARKIGNQNGEANALGDLGYAHYALSNYPQAIKYHQQRLLIAREIGDRGSEGTALGGLGMAHSALGNYSQAIEYQKQFLYIAREVGDRNGEGNALGNLGNIYCALGNYSQAIDCQEKFLIIAREIGKHRGEGTALGNLGNIYSSQGNYNQAIECYQKCLVIAHEVGQRREEGIALVNWGATLIKLEQYSDAQQHLQKALNIFQDLGTQSGEAQVLQSFAELYQKRGEIEAAQSFCDRALKIASGLSIPLVQECEEFKALLSEGITTAVLKREEC
ncbi:TPR repeat-containing protein [Leptolyngbya sp. PCC 7375]|nr:TPR repeat-containing protein [Leptolyngbya sp. PCC 7375]